MSDTFLLHSLLLAGEGMAVATLLPVLALVRRVLLPQMGSAASPDLDDCFHWSVGIGSSGFCCYPPIS